MRRRTKRRLETIPSEPDTDTHPKKKISADTSRELDFFDGFPDDIVLSILSRLSSSADSPHDLIAVLLTSKRFKKLSMDVTVLAKVSRSAMAIRVDKWSESSHTFLIRCCRAGNLDACYFLGMIRFYCFGMRDSGAALMARAALGSYAAAIFSLAVIHFNGSGGTVAAKRPRAGFTLSARAALLGHVDAIREVGYCFLDGHGATTCRSLGNRYLVYANFYEVLTGYGLNPSSFSKDWMDDDASDSDADTDPNRMFKRIGERICCILQRHVDTISGTDINRNLKRKDDVSDADPANRFIREWYGSGLGEDNGLRMCSNGTCGRRETRTHEFRKCAVCGSVNYCSRACQARHWNVVHRATCRTVDALDVGGEDVVGGSIDVV